MPWALLLAIISANFSLAAGAFETYAYIYQGKEIRARVGEVDGVKVNDLCETETKKCAALRAYRGRSKFSALKGVRQGNFAGAYCERLGGSQLFAANEKKIETQFCLFGDLTFIDAKALYERHAKKAGAKK